MESIEREREQGRFGEREREKGAETEPPMAAAPPPPSAAPSTSSTQHLLHPAQPSQPGSACNLHDAASKSRPSREPETAGRRLQPPPFLPAPSTSASSGLPTRPSRAAPSTCRSPLAALLRDTLLQRLGEEKAERSRRLGEEEEEAIGEIFTELGFDCGRRRGLREDVLVTGEVRFADAKEKRKATQTTGCRCLNCRPHAHAGPIVIDLLVQRRSGKRNYRIQPL